MKDDQMNDASVMRCAECDCETGGAACNWIGQGGTYWTVRMEVFAFDSKADAVAYSDALIDAFAAMPESAEYGASTIVLEENADKEYPALGE